MKATRFFRHLWRINGVLILLASILAITVMSFAAIQLMDFGHSKPDQVVRVDQQTQERTEPPTLGTFQEMSGIPFMRASLTFGEKSSKGSFSCSAASSSTRNYFFLNSETLDGRWLFSGNKQLILDSDELTEKVQGKDSEKPTSRTIAFFYEVVDTDTNGDGLLTAEDKHSIAYSRPDGTQYTTVIKGMDKILGRESIDDGRKHVVVYEMEKKPYAALISTSSFAIEGRKELPSQGDLGQHLGTLDQK